MNFFTLKNFRIHPLYFSKFKILLCFCIVFMTTLIVTDYAVAKKKKLKKTYDSGWQTTYFLSSIFVQSSFTDDPLSDNPPIKLSDGKNLKYDLSPGRVVGFGLKSDLRFRYGKSFTTRMPYKIGYAFATSRDSYHSLTNSIGVDFMYRFFGIDPFAGMHINGNWFNMQDNDTKMNSFSGGLEINVGIIFNKLRYPIELCFFAQSFSFADELEHKSKRYPIAKTEDSQHMLSGVSIHVYFFKKRLGMKSKAKAYERPKAKKRKTKKRKPKSTFIK